MVLVHVQSMFERFQESFERRLLQRGTEVPRERSRLPLHDPSPGETRVTEFSSQEDSGPDTTVKVASMVRVLSPGAAQADRHIVLAEHGDHTITVHLGATGGAPACRLPSIESRTDLGEKSRILGREVMLSQEDV